MYNRYIPQPDGTYRRNAVPERSNPQPKTAPQRPEPPMAEPACPPPPPPEPRCANCMHAPFRRSAPERTVKSAPAMGIGSFLRQLLPKDFDVEDLMVVLLLLLMAGDCHEDQNSALLTLMLYLFL